MLLIFLHCTTVDTMLYFHEVQSQDCIRGSFCGSFWPTASFSWSVVCKLFSTSSSLLNPHLLRCETERLKMGKLPAQQILWTKNMNFIWILLQFKFLCFKNETLLFLHLWQVISCYVIKKSAFLPYPEHQLPSSEFNLLCKWISWAYWKTFKGSDKTCLGFLFNSAEWMFSVCRRTEFEQYTMLVKCHMIHMHL